MGHLTMIGNIETIAKSSRKYLVKKPGKHDIKELQQTATLGAPHTHTGISESIDVTVQNI